MTTQRDGVIAIQDWSVGYVRRHPLASLTTVGEQFVLGVRTIQYFFIDLVTGRFQWQEFVRQGAFMAGTAVLPTCSVRSDGRWDEISPAIWRATSAARGSKSRQANGGSS